MPQDAIDLLGQSDLLGGVPEDRLRALDPQPEWVTITSGDTLIAQGQPGEAFFLLVHGRMRVFVADEAGGSRLVGEVLPGEGVGEMSLLTDDLTSATVRAMHDCELIRFSRNSYKQLMENSPEAALQVTRTVIKRLREGLSGKRHRVHYGAIAIIPIDSAVDVEYFSETLKEQLSVFAPTSVIAPDSLGAEDADLVIGTDRLASEKNRAITSKLLAFEDGNTVSIYRGDFEPTVWTRLCLRQADLVLLVTTTESPTALSSVETSLINVVEDDLAPRCDLVLLHPEIWQPHCGMASWIAPRTITESHHLRQRAGPDFARLARILTNNAISVVLGGGGARGLAQIGVLRALQEARIPIDRIGGTSMGSMIGALFAIGHSIDEVTRISREIWVEGKPLSDYTFPAMAIVRGRKLHNFIKGALHGWDVEDLPITYFCVSGNLTNTDLVLHDTGVLWEGVRASGSIPGAGPPMFHQGNILVDGGVLNNLPGDIMLERYGGAIVIVDVSPQDPMSVPADYDEVPSGWWILWRKLIPFGESIPVPGIFEILARTATLSSDRLAKKTYALANLLLVPPIGHVGTLAFDKIDQLIDIGYRHAVAQLHGPLEPRIARYADVSALPAPGDAALAEAPAKPIDVSRTGPRWKTMAIAATLLLTVAIGGWNYLKADPPPVAVEAAAGSQAALATVAEHEGANILPVEGIVVRHADGYDVKESYAGRVVSRRESNLGFDRPGTLIEVLVDEGSGVVKGELLARLGVRALLARREELRAELTLSRATRKQTEARLDLAKITAERRTKLLKRDNVSRQAFDEALFDVKALRSELAANAADTQKVGALLHSLEVDIEKSSMRAPFEGTIVRRLADEGTAVTAGTAVLRLIEDGVKEIRVGIPTRVAPNLSIGAEYGIDIDGRQYRCRLRALLAALNAETRTMPAIFEVIDPERVLLSGQLARLQLGYRVSMKGFWLPLDAMVGGRRGLWNAYALVESGEKGLMRTSRRELLMLHGESDRAYVRGTLKDGDIVVAGGLHRLVPEQLVKLGRRVE